MAQRILVVDDREPMRSMLRGELAGHGFTDVLEAADGAEGLEALRAGGVGLVIARWDLPGESGHHLLRTIRESEDFAHTPFIMVVAEGRQDQIVATIRGGADAYIMQPFRQDRLAAELEKLFTI
jgi:two-component system chemotaxis response regulator CheY